MIPKHLVIDALESIQKKAQKMQESSLKRMRWTTLPPSPITRDLHSNATLNEKEQCPTCHSVFANLENHKCGGGTCPHCHSQYTNLRPHLDRCAVLRCKTAPTREDIEAFLKKAQRTCDWCGTVHAMAKTSFREWRGETLCLDCFRPCTATVNATWKRVHQMFIDGAREGDEGRCHRCIKRVLSKDGETLAHFQYDHVNFWDKTESLCVMIGRGDAWPLIEQEAKKCVLLCGQCHSYVTAAEQVCGFIDLKRALNRANKQSEKKKSSNDDECSDDSIVENESCKESDTKKRGRKRKAIRDEVEPVYERRIEDAVTVIRDLLK